MSEFLNKKQNFHFPKPEKWHSTNHAAGKLKPIKYAVSRLAQFPARTFVLAFQALGFKLLASKLINKTANI